ncbi:MAG: DUF2203 family protein [Gammaproteobacteria bacterium]|nr:DUF2203 family protein [Gemmatimonadota bacterium]NIU79791.1 DUF2203 family protein [Gammaproteobacteria bacterium]
MPFSDFRVFTIEEANALVPKIARLTERTQRRLDALGAPVDGDKDGLDDAARRIIETWARSVLVHGGQPKGVFTVDFRAPDPNLLWCWAPGERAICHRHFTWESFRDRVSISQRDDFWPGRN